MPAQTLLASAAIDTAGTAFCDTVMVIALLKADVMVHAALLVNAQVITSLLFNAASL